MSIIDLSNGLISGDEFNKLISRNQERAKNNMYKVGTHLLYTYNHIHYCIQILDEQYNIKILGLIKPKEKLTPFTKKYEILLQDTILKAEEEDLVVPESIAGLVLTTIQYIEYQVYLHEKSNDIIGANGWKQFKLKFLPTVIKGGIA